MNGIIYTIAGDDQVPKLLMSAKALRKVSQIPFQAYCWLSPTGQQMLRMADIPFVQETSLPCEDQVRVSRFLKTSVHRITPFDKTMYMDNDIVPLLDPKPLFDWVPTTGVLFTMDAGKTVDKFSPYACPGRRLHKEIAKHFQVNVDPKWEIWNGGFFIFDKHLGKHFMDLWRKRQLLVIKDKLKGWRQRDQGTLISTVWSMGLQNQACLPCEWNWLHGLHDGLTFDEKDGIWYNEHSTLQIGNLHLCLAWGKEESETWRLVDAYVNGNPYRPNH